MTTSKELFQRACEAIPGGVNSPVRALNSVDSDPVYFKRGAGCRMYDLNDKEYIDFCASWGPLILGHADPDVVEAVKKTAENGLSFGTCNPLEVEMAELVKEMVPSIEMIRCVNSGTEAVMTAVRLARGVTGRKYIIKFDGCYHGHSDYLLVAAGSGVLTHGITSSAGVNDSAVSEVIVLPYNDIEAVRKAFEKYDGQIAAVIVEPVVGNMGLVKPEGGFHRGLRELTALNGALLIFDEVITGFRFGPTTYGELVGIKADITCLGKIIGGGMPVGAIGGSKKIMEHLAPVGPVYQAGTLSGNPVALAAGIATLKKLRDETLYKRLYALTEKVAETVNGLSRKNSLPVACAWDTGIFTIFFRSSCPENLAEVKECDFDKFTAFFKAMLERGYYMSPSQYELNFITAAHSEEDISKFCKALREVILLIFSHSQPD
jgi:glutamate-1-semialdehyde 2,1-aminomutase